MKGDKQVIAQLNKILGNELVSINQYFMHAKLLKNWGYEKLAAKSKEESIDEMKHADYLADRILFLGGIPNFQDLGKLYIGQTVPEIFESDLKLEIVAIKDLKEAIQATEAAHDYSSGDLLLSILKSEESHVDWLSTQLDLIQQLGEKNYLQLQVS